MIKKLRADVLLRAQEQIEKKRALGEEFPNASVLLTQKESLDYTIWMLKRCTLKKQMHERLLEKMDQGLEMALAFIESNHKDAEVINQILDLIILADELNKEDLKQYNDLTAEAMPASEQASECDCEIPEEEIKQMKDLIHELVNQND